MYRKKCDRHVHISRKCNRQVHVSQKVRLASACMEKSVIDKCMYRSQCGQQVYSQNMFSTMCLFPDHLSSELCPEGYVCVCVGPERFLVPGSLHPAQPGSDFLLPDHPSSKLSQEAYACVHPERFLASRSPHPAQSGNVFLLPDQLSSELYPEACVCVDPKRFLVFRLSNGRRNVQV